MAGPASDRDEGGVSLRLYKHRAEAEARSREGFLGLCALALRDELAWLQRELQELAEFKARYQGSSLEMRTQAFEHLERYLFHREQILPLRQEDFDAVLVQAKQRLRGLASRFISLVDSLLEARREIRLWGPVLSRAGRGLGAAIARRLPRPRPLPPSRPSAPLPKSRRGARRTRRNRSAQGHTESRVDRGVPEPVGKARRGGQFARAREPKSRNCAGCWRNIASRSSPRS